MIILKLSDQEQLAWLRLSRTEGVGPVTFNYLIQRYGTASQALEALPELSVRGGRQMGVQAYPLFKALQDIEDGLAVDAHLICACEPDFPDLLRRIDPIPPLIWVMGRRDLLSTSSVAVVGARIASGAAQKFARQLAGDLGAAGYCVVSGMARGVDAAAHQGALETGTVAVLGGGVRNIYPQENTDLFHAIRQRGCVISENSPLHVAQARDFPRRNRLISGLSSAVVVVEAEQKSGSLITARLALEQNREVFAVPGSPLDPRTKGTNDLIRQGAHVCESAADVIRLLQSMPGVWSDGPLFVSDDHPDPDFQAEPQLQQRILDLISHTPISRDEVIRGSGAPSREVLAILVELALAGRVDLLAGGQIVLL
jgi:DNA processing protein